MKTTKTTKPASYKEIIKQARKNGYTQLLHNGYPVKVTCEECKKQADKTLKGKYPFWVQTRNAIIFNNDNFTIHACPCGHRVKFSKNHTKTQSSNVAAVKIKEKTYCKTNGCNAILPKGRKSYCYKCRPPQKQSTKVTTEKEDKSSIKM